MLAARARSAGRGLAGQRTSQCLLDQREDVGAADAVSQLVVQCPPLRPVGVGAGEKPCARPGSGDGPRRRCVR
jgi:hypothetical protein